MLKRFGTIVLAVMVAGLIGGLSANMYTRAAGPAERR